MTLKVVVLGQGLGFSLANLFASKGISTLGLDIKKESFENPRLDPAMKNYIKRHSKIIEKNLSFTTKYSDISNQDFVFCFVETPLESNNRLGLNSVIRATGDALRVMKKDTTYVMMSTLPVGGSKVLMKKFGKNL